MIAYILDEGLETLALVDTFDSFIWTDRYGEAGDFEIRIPASSPAMEYVKLNNYLSIRESEHIMVIESIELQTDVEYGDFYSVSGRSLESILDRRVIFERLDYSGGSYAVPEVIYELLYYNGGGGTTASRKLNMVVEEPSEDIVVGSKSYTGYFYGDNLYDAVVELCRMENLGLKIIPDHKTGGFIASLYKGVDRSYEQDEVPYVVFSPSYGNILASKLLESTKVLKTVVYVGAGIQEGTNMDLTVSTNIGGAERGLKRRELFVDGSTISRTNYDSGEEMSENAYKRRLQDEGKKTLYDYQIEETFEAEIEATRQFIYGRDFFVGDIVQVANGYGSEKAYQIVEVMRIHDITGESLVPTFVAY